MLLLSFSSASLRVEQNAWMNAGLIQTSCQACCLTALVEDWWHPLRVHCDLCPDDPALV